MELLVVTNYFFSHKGGLDIVAGDIAAQLAARGVGVRWVAEGPAPAAADGIEFVPVRAWNWFEQRFGIPAPLWSPSSLLTLFKCVREATVVHIHDSIYPASIFAALFAWTTGRRLVLTQHIAMVPYRNKFIRGLMAFAYQTAGRFVFWRADQVVFCSDKVSRYFSQKTAFRTPPDLIHNGLDTQLFRPATGARLALKQSLGLDPARPVCLFVGRFVEKKGLHHLRRLASELPEAQFVMVGWGPIDPSKWNLQNVSCRGAIDRAALVPLYQAADLLVLPSIGEGFPVVVQEALACGTPALVSEDTAGGDDAAKQYLVLSSLNAGALVSAVRKFFGSDARTAAAQRARVAHFARDRYQWSGAIDRYAAHFERLGAAPQRAELPLSRRCG